MRSVTATRHGPTAYPRSAPWRAVLGTVLFFGGLTAAFFWPLFAPPPWRQYMAAGDFINQFYPFRAFAAAEWWARRPPLWNPYIFAGHPFAADIQTAVFYPPAWLTILFFGRDGLPLTALELEMAAHYPLAAFFTYALVQRLTGQRLAAVVAGAVFAFGGFLTSYPAQQLPMLESAVWLPLALYGLERGLTGSRPPLGWIGAGGALGLAILAGHPQTVLLSAYTAAAYLLVRGRLLGHAWRHLGAGLLLTGTTALGLAAVQIVPTVEFFLLSTRQGLPYAVAGHGYDLKALVGLILPEWRGERALYVGVLPLLLATGALRTLPLARTGFWGGLALIALVLSLGATTPLFWLLYHAAPGFALFRDQERAMLLYNLAMAVLAGLGMAAGASQPVWPARPLLLRLALSGLALALLAWGLLRTGLVGLPADVQTDQIPGGLLRLAALCLAAALWLWWTGRAAASRLAPALLLGLLALDLWTAHYGHNFQTANPDPRPRLLAIARFIHADIQEPFRVRGETDALFPPNYAALLNLPTIVGDTPLVLERVQRLLDTKEEWRLWQLLNVKYALARKDPEPGLEVAFRQGDIRVMRMIYSLPRAWAVRRVEVATSPTEALARVLRPDYHPGDIVVLEEPPTIGPIVPGDRPDVRIVYYSPRRIIVDAVADAPAILVLSETYYPGWRAWRDDQPVPILRANFVTRALELPPGRHRFTLVYDPWSVKVGALLSGLTLALAGGVVLASRWPVRP
mgnify:CR=1 FL=1